MSEGENPSSEHPDAGSTLRRSSPARKLLFTAALLAGVVVLMEVGLRVGYRLWKGTWDFLPETRFASELYQPHPYLCYVMRPGVHVSGYGGEVRTNRWGFRGPDVTLTKPPDTVRIVCLGGSTTFSLSASDNDRTWPNQLQRILNERYAPIRFEVLNFGAPAYCAIESFLTLGLRALDFDPDVVLIHDGWNDGPAVFRPDRRGDFTHFRTFYTRWSGGWLAKTAIGRLFLLAAPNFGWKHYIGPHEPSIDGDLLFQRYVESTILLAQPRGIEPVVITIADSLPADQTKWTQRHGTIELLRRLVKRARELARRRNVPLIDLAVQFPKDPKYFADEAHKNDEGLLLVAQMVADGLDREGVNARLFARRFPRAGVTAPANSAP